MHEVTVILRDLDTNPPEPIEILGDPGLAREGESVVWHFTALDTRASHAKIFFDNTDRGGQFFKIRDGGRSHERTVKLDDGVGHMLGVVPEDEKIPRSRSEKYTVTFLAAGEDLYSEDPEIIIRKP
jgi:hypothetical protein